MIRPTSGRSRVSVPVLSNSTVSISESRSSARPSFTSTPRCEHSERRRHPDAGAHIAVEHGGSALRAHRAQRQRADRQRGHDRRVGQSFAPLLRSELVAGGVAQYLGDLRGGGRLARLLHGDVNLACHHDGGREHLIADPLLGGRRFAGQRMLVDHRQPVDDDAVDRHDLAGVHHDDVALVERVERNLDLLPVHEQPDKARLFAERAEQHLL
jgi:hypothetical protein